MIDENWFLLFVLCLATWLLSHVYRSIAIRWGVLDFPNDRSAHFDPTPVGGGLVFLLLFLSGFGYFYLQGIVENHLLFALLGPLVVAITGFIDDINSLSVRLRSIAYLSAAAWCMVWIDFPLINLLGYELEFGFVGFLIGTFYLAGLLNLYNFMDGIDGIAAGEAVFTTAGAATILFLNQGETNDLLILLFAVSLGFLVINWPKARVFMGDVGSGFLGITLGLLSLHMVEVSLWSWLILLAWFLTDSGLTMLIRLLRGDKIYESHNFHAYQHLSRKVGSTKALVYILSVNLIWLFPLAFLADTYRDWGVVLLILAFLPLLLAQYLIGAGQEVSKEGYLVA